MKRLVLFFLLIISNSGFSQVAPDKYFVEFTDKEGTPYSIDHPENFLSERSIQRRNRHSVPVSWQDLPVNPAYVEAVASTGAKVITRTKWYNGVTIYTSSPSVLQAVRDLPCVKQVLKGQKSRRISQYHQDKFSFLKEPVLPENDSEVTPSGSADGYNYGLGYHQLHMLNGDFLHNLGFRGEGMVIAILDAGFLNADNLPVFDSLRNNNQILGTHDFVLPGNDVYRENNHGMAVLSTMGGNLPGVFIGTAPEADFWLIRTEDVGSENYIEEYNWVSGAEFADSVGADLINSSLGYTTFDDPMWDHSWSDLNGNTTLVTRGANIAVSKGIAVVKSVGNSGTKPWRYLSAPADGDAVLAVGAVDSLRNYSSFSSHGIPGNQVKPNVVAMGERVFVAGPDSTLYQSSGTSFSAPIMAGLVACLWQSKPEVSVAHLLRAVEMSADHFTNPDTLYGFGIPDFSNAYLHLGVIENQFNRFKPVVFPNPFATSLSIFCFSEGGESIKVVLTGLTGQEILHKDFLLSAGVNRVQIETGTTCSSGFYVLSVFTRGNNWHFIIVKL